MAEIEAFHSNTWIILIQALDADGDPLDLALYKSACFAVREKRDSETYLIEPKAGTFVEPLNEGWIRFELDYTETEIARGDYWYGVMLVQETEDPYIDKRFTIAKDQCRVKAPIAVCEEVY